MSLPLEPIHPSCGDGPSDGGDTVTPCDVFEPMLGPHLDRELTRAEEVRLDTHVDACAKCRTRLAHLETLSSALRAWDAEANALVAPPKARIQNAVMARVAETSHRRRVDDRVLRFVHLATAACVLIALGLGLSFGLAWEAPVLSQMDPARAEVAVRAGALSTLHVPDPVLDPVALETLAFERSSAMRIERDVAWLQGPDLEARPVDVVIERSALDTAQFARLEAFSRRFERERALEALVGEGGVHVALGDGETRVLSLSAYRFAKARGWFDRWQGLPQRADGTPAHETLSAAADPKRTTPPNTHDDQPIGLAARDMLRPMPGLHGLDINGLKSSPPMTTWPGTPGDVGAEARVIIRGVPRTSTSGAPRLRSGDGVGHPLETTDPIEAQRRGWLRFEESGVEPETVVAFVKGNPYPILLPAGQIVEKGITDRVIAEPILLPASPREERRENVPCRVIRVGTRRENALSPVLTEWIAGPAIRALLAQGASEDAVISSVEAHVRRGYVLRGSPDPRHLAAFSLLELFQSRDSISEDEGAGESASPAAGARHWARRALESVRRSGSVWRSDFHAGFVALDGLEGVLGIERVSLTGDAATALLTRLYVGYQLEAMLRQAGGVRAKGAGLATLTLDEAVELIQRDGTSFLCVRESAPGVSPAQRLSTLEMKRAAMVFQAFEIDGQPALVSLAPVAAEAAK